MLLQRVQQLPEGHAWQYEVKFDGYRMQTLKDGATLRLLSRNGADYTDRFPEVADAVGRLKPRKLLEGSREHIVSAVREHGLEGVVAKRADSIYEPGKRSGAWVKLPLRQTATFLLGGFRRMGGIAVLLVGQFDRDQFRFAGKVTQGLRGLSRFELVAPKQLRLRGCPFVDLPNCLRRS